MSSFIRRLRDHAKLFPIETMAALVAVALLLTGSADSDAVEAGQRAPRFELPAVDGKGQVSLASYQGKVIYLDFWASWCPPCRTAMPIIEDLRKEFPPEDFQVVAINVDSDLKKAQKLLAKEKVGYPSGSDPQGQLPKRFQVKTMPTSFLIDRHGVVRYVHEGFRRGDAETLRAEIRKLLGNGRK